MENIMDMNEFEGQYGPDSRYQKRGSRHGEPDVYSIGLALIQEYEDAPAYPVESFVDLDKGGMVAHLIEFHGVYECSNQRMSLANGTKATKDEMISLHNRIHATLDNPMSRFVHSGQKYDQNTGEYSPQFKVGGWPLPTQKHSHEAPVLSAAATAVRDNAPAGDKPLSAAEANVLKELVNNDFAGLKAEMSAFASDALMQKQAEVNQEWDEKEAAMPDFAKDATKIKRAFDSKAARLREKYTEDMKALGESYEDEFGAVVEKAKEQSVVLVEETEQFVNEAGGKASRPVFKASVEGRNEALVTAAHENRKFLDRAMMTLEGQRLQAQRKVLVSRVNTQGATILDSIPDAKSMMVEAQRTGGLRQIEQNSGIES